MITSEARIAANRANALRSSGPKTAEGKERSRANSLKHGLTGSGVVLPIEDEAEVQKRFDGFQADYGPTTDSGRCLIRRAAMLSIRLERCAVYEAAMTSTRMRHAAADFDEARMAEVDALIHSIAEAPGMAVRRLRRMPEGVDRMIASWMDLRSDLAHYSGAAWTYDHEGMALCLTGRQPGGFGVCRIGELSMAVRGEFDLLAPEDGKGLDHQARQTWAVGQLLALIDAEIAGLRDHLATLDLDAIEADRDRAVDRAIFDLSRESALARKYEAAAERMMYRAIQEMEVIEAANITPVASGSASTHAPMGSFFPADARTSSPNPSPPAKSTATAPRPVVQPAADARIGPVAEFSMVPQSMSRTE